MFLIFFIWLIFLRIFIILRNTEILIVLYFWLEVYTQSILKNKNYEKNNFLAVLKKFYDKKWNTL